MDFSELVMDYSEIPNFSHFTARDGEELPYRYYPSSSNKLIILLHGSGWHSRYFYALAKEISSGGRAKVITPDLRGHGENPKKRGDIDYVGQLDDDLEDLLQFVHKKYSPSKVFIEDHSSGGGLALRFAGSKHGSEADAYLFLAPYLAHDSPTVNQNSGWANAKLVKIIGISLLNALGIHWFDHTVTITFNLPAEFCDGTETLAYTHALINSYSPADYKTDLKNINKSSLLLVGAKDEAMIANAFPSVASMAKEIKLKILPDVTHMGIVVNKTAIDDIVTWISEH